MLMSLNYILGIYIFLLIYYFAFYVIIINYNIPVLLDPIICLAVYLAHSLFLQNKCIQGQ